MEPKDGKSSLEDNDNFKDLVHSKIFKNKINSWVNNYINFFINIFIFNKNLKFYNLTIIENHFKKIL